MIFVPCDSNGANTANGSCTIDSGSTVILATPSCGNVGQLCVDSVLASFSARKADYCQGITRIGSIFSEDVLPMTGFECFPGGSEFKCSSIEVYRLNCTAKIYFIIQRAPCKRSSNQKYMKELVEFLSSVNVRNAVMVTGCSVDYLELDRSSSNCEYFSYYSPNSIEFLGSILPNLSEKLLQLPLMNKDCLLLNEWNCNEMRNDLSSQYLDEDETCLKHHGSYPVTSHCYCEDSLGIAPIDMFLTKCMISEMKNTSINAFVIGKFVNRGENTMDGKDLAQMIFNSMISSFPESSTTDLCIPSVQFMYHPLSWQKRLEKAIDSNSAGMF